MKKRTTKWNMKDLLAGFSVGIFIVVLFTYWNVPRVMQISAMATTILYALTSYQLIKNRTETENKNLEQIDEITLTKTK